ncbi:serine hydrolase [Desulfofundulus salinus]|uniref:Serine hydrolase n=1 Tax=Desulfofundulus salinus TaxID=2419843 RepID=A0A494WV97_9FIRM|nr:serine hydrolase [Desulfofundulus salinum]RKO66813.1 serine hydrolase [Desulfofundulus salinum]
MVNIFRLVVFLLVLSLAAGPAAAASHSVPVTGRLSNQPVRNIDYSPLKKQMEKFVREKKSTFAIYFEDLASGASFGINADKPMVAASTVKLPMALYINHLVVQGKMHWHDRVSYRKATDYEDGSGVLRYEARDGDTYSLRLLTNLAITISDNVAFRMLARHVGRPNFYAYMKELGGRTVYPGGKNLTTARDLATYVKATLDFARRYPQEGQRLLDDLAHPSFHIGLPGLLPHQVMVAHKEGDLDGVANDCGVVFGRRPYILVVLSSGVKETREGFADIARLSKMAYDFQESLPAAEIFPLYQSPK